MIMGFLIFIKVVTVITLEEQGIFFGIDIIANVLILEIKFP